MPGMLPIVLALGLTSLSTPPLASTSLVMAKAGDAIVTITIDDSQFPAATALDIAVDGEINTTVLVFGKIGHPAYTALLHTLSPGRHEITALRSPFWSWPATAGVPTLTA